MVAFKVIFAFLVAAVIGLAYVTAEHDTYDHGHSHISISNKHWGKFGYDIKHGKHGHSKGWAHPHGYGGFGDRR